MRISDWSSDVALPIFAGQHRQIMPRVIDRAVAPEGAGMFGNDLLAAAHDDACRIRPDLYRAPCHRRENRVAVAIEADQAGARHRMLALVEAVERPQHRDRKSTRLNSSH